MERRPDSTMANFIKLDADKKEEETTTTAVDQAESIQEGELSQKELENKEGVDANQSREEIEPKE